MSDEANAPVGGESAPAPVVVNTPAPDVTFNSPTGAAKMLAELRWKRSKEQPAESAPEPATAEPQLSGEDNAAPPQEAPGETVEAEPAEVPPIEPPRSWTKEAKERWQTLPRETQEYLASREQERDREVRRSQNEAAEKSKAIEAERLKAEEARKEYEAKLPALMQALHDASPFADIKSMADVEKMQAEDPFRFQQFQVYQWKMQGAQAELQQAEQRKATEAQTQWAKHVQEEDAKAAELIPELADKDKGEKLRNRVVKELFPDLGFNEGELADLASGKQKLSIYDHRVQRLLADSLKLRDIQNAPKAVVKPNLPPVQQPGTSKPAGSAQSEAIKALTQKLEQTGSLRDAQALRAAQLAAAKRRAS